MITCGHLLCELRACTIAHVHTVLFLPLLHPSRVLPDKMAAVDAALSLARVIASKSPVAVYGTKHNLLYARDHSVEDGLEYAVSPEGSFHVTEHLVMDG